MADYNIAVIGGGAAGLCAAIGAKQAAGNSSVCILERMPKVGKKILVTGNGRCNFSHIPVEASRYTGSFKPDKILAQYPDLRDFFLGLGVASAADGEGRIYPLSNTASSVHEGLSLKVKQLGIEVKSDLTVESIQRQKGFFVIKSAGKTITAQRIVLASGGKASPTQGSDGSGFSLLRQLGVEITALSPALCPLPADKSLMKVLEGVRVRCKAGLYRKGMLLKEQSGEVQFIKTALSGICIFNLSLLTEPDFDYTVRLDLMPDYTEKQAAELIAKAIKARQGLAPDLQISGIFHWKTAAALLKTAFPKMPKMLTDNHALTIAKAAKAWDFPVTAPTDFTSAQVTKGGVHGSQVGEDMQVKSVKGLYVAGEILDIAGECGGYNLHFAWASGLAAGKAAGESLC